MKKASRRFSLVLVLVLLVTLLSACQVPDTSNNPGSNTGAADNNNQQSNTETNTETEKTATSNEKKLNYPIDAKNVKLSLWVELDAGASKDMKSYEEGLAFQELQKRTGVDIEYIHPAQGQAKEQFNIMVASGELPDLIQGADKLYNGGGQKALEDGLFIRLNDLVEQYAPDYQAARNLSADARRQSVTDRGDMWAVFPIMKRENMSWMGLSINKQWLDDVNLDVPVTIQDWTNMLRAFRDQKGAQAPLVANVDFMQDALIDDSSLFLSAYGIGAGFYRQGDVIKYGPMQPEFKQYLELLRGWYEEGLIDNDFPVRDINGIRALFTSQKSGAIYQALSVTHALAKGAGFEVVDAYYPVLNKGDKIEDKTMDWAVTPGEIAVTSQCKNPEVAVQYLNYGYTQDGEMLYNFGIEGTSYNMVNGEPVFTDTVNNYPVQPAVSWRFKIHMGPMLRWGAYSDAPTLRDKEVVESREMLSKAGYSLKVPPVTLTAEEGNAFSSIMNNINTYRNEMVFKFILGTESMDKFDDYVNELKKMKIEEAISYQQAAYNRYLAR